MAMKQLSYNLNVIYKNEKYGKEMYTIFYNLEMNNCSIGNLFNFSIDMLSIN